MPPTWLQHEPEPEPHLLIIESDITDELELGDVNLECPFTTDDRGSHLEQHHCTILYDRPLIELAISDSPQNLPYAPAVIPDKSMWAPTSTGEPVEWMMVDGYKHKAARIEMQWVALGSCWWVEEACNAGLSYLITGNAWHHDEWPDDWPRQRGVYPVVLRHEGRGEDFRSWLELV